MSELKSPFFIQRDFLSVKQCEQIRSMVGIAKPNVDNDGYPTKFERRHDAAEQIIFEKLKTIVPTLENHYDWKYQGTESMLFQSFPEGMKGPAVEPKCESSNYIKKAWVKVKDIDLTATIWLNQFNDQVPMDPRLEVMGGKMEFPAYGFSFVPEVGTIVIHPAGPHFIYAISQIQVGNLHQVRFNLSGRNKDGVIWQYNPQKFASGGWREWLKEYF